MKESPASAVGTSVIIASEPQLFVSDLETACAFYVRKLGFKVELSMENRRSMRRSLAVGDD